MSARRDRMIAAFHKLSDDTRVLPGRNYGKCKVCLARVEWVKTTRGKMMPQQPNTGEPHFPHCGKQNWTIEQWDTHMAEIKRREIKHNKKRNVTNPRRLTQCGNDHTLRPVMVLVQ
jgi:hypothetical protein